MREVREVYIRTLLGFVAKGRVVASVSMLECEVRLYVEVTRCDGDRKLEGRILLCDHVLAASP